MNPGFCVERSYFHKCHRLFPSLERAKVTEISVIKTRKIGNGTGNLSSYILKSGGKPGALQLVQVDPPDPSLNK